MEDTKVYTALHFAPLASCTMHLLRIQIPENVTYFPSVCISEFWRNDVAVA
jgi:hypothetical protein